VSDSTLVGSMKPGRYGVAGVPQLSLEPIATATVWNLQGSPDHQPLVQQARILWGLGSLPAPHRALGSQTHQLLWTGPKSWLVIGNDRSLQARSEAASAFSDTRDQINRAGGALFDVSASRIGWIVRGARAPDLLASVCPLDLEPKAFAPGSCAQSLLGHVVALYHRQSDGDFAVHVARSFSHGVWEAMCTSAAQYGYEVLPPPA